MILLHLKKMVLITGEEIIWLRQMMMAITTYIASVTYIAGSGTGSSIFNAKPVLILFSIYNFKYSQYCVNDADGDGICDENESAGCTDEKLSTIILMQKLTMVHVLLLF